MSGVRLESVRKEYENGYVAVHDLSLSIHDGELLVLVGPSGCGKSTTLRMIAGLESVSAGRLYIGDRLVNGVPPKDRDIAMVFQNYALYPHMSVRDNLAFGLKLRKLPRDEIAARVRNAATVLGIDAILDRKPRQLSGGQRQRVALGRAIVREPSVFLFDEPLSNLDAKLRVQTRKEIARLHRRLGATMIYVTHDQVEAMTLGQRIVVMNAGIVQQIDTPLNLYHRPVNRFVAGFIGSPSMNFVNGRIEREGEPLFRAMDGAFTVSLGATAPSELASYDGREVVLGVRPEDVRIGADTGAAPLRDANAVVEGIEPMGNELFVYARAGSHELVARVPPQPLPEPGGAVALALRLDGLHFFDRESEAHIGAAPGAPGGKELSAT